MYMTLVNPEMLLAAPPVTKAGAPGTSTGGAWRGPRTEPNGGTGAFCATRSAEVGAVTEHIRASPAGRAHRCEGNSTTCW